MNLVVIGVGSNIRPAESIARAKRRIAEFQRIISESSLVETEPVGYGNQPNFLNGAILIETPMERGELKTFLREVERDLGRSRGTMKHGPRTIDLDIVVWNGQLIDTDIYERDFLRDAVREVWPDLNLNQG